MLASRSACSTSYAATGRATRSCAPRRATHHARAPHLATRATARADTVPVWETLVMVNGEPGSTQSEEEQQELLDTLWSLQYRTPGACCASAGPIVHAADADGSHARAAVYYRFSAQAQAERFVAGPVFAEAKARLLGTHGSVSLALWKVLVPNDMEALFKRGPAFDAGVDVVLSIVPADPAVPAPVEVVVELVGRLQQAALAGGGMQVSCGADLLHPTTRFMWMARFPQEDAGLRFLRCPALSPLVSALSGGAQGAAAGAGAAGPLRLTSLALIEVGSVNQSKQGV